jgi:hypothetical protein
MAREDGNRKYKEIPDQSYRLEGKTGEGPTELPANDGPGWHWRTAAGHKELEAAIRYPNANIDDPAMGDQREED